MPLDDLLRTALAAPDDETRATANAELAAYPNALTEIAQKLSSPEWEQRALGLHFVTRLAPPPPLFSSGVIHCLRSPLGDDPLGDEMALVLVCCGLLAREVQGFRDVLAARVRAVDAAKGPRTPVMQRLAHETLAKVDAEIADGKRRWDSDIDRIVELVRAGQRDEALQSVTADSEHTYYPELGRAARWEAAGEKLLPSDRELARFCWERALEDYRWHASGASSGGEGLARMIDVRRIEALLA